jgi:hypothetical protein
VNAAARFVVLTEDSGASGWKPVVSLVRAICDQLVVGVRWDHIDVSPRDDADAQTLRALAGNQWKGSNGTAHGLRVRLAQYIANKLLVREGNARFVFFHVDADRVWSAGDPHDSENATKFERLVRTPVRVILLGALAKRGRSGELDALMARLHLVVPSYSIEAWLYQSTARAAELCESRRCRGAHVAIFQRWATDRTLLDDLSQPKDAKDERGTDLHCLGDADKDALAQAFPAREVRAAQRSFARAVEAVGEDGALLHALIATGG